MNNSGNPWQARDELRLATTGIQFLALLTGAVYLLAFISGSPASLRIDGSGRTPWFMFILVLVATVGLLSAWRWSAIGGITAVVGGITLFSLVLFQAESNKLLAAFLYGSPFMIAGSLELLCRWQGRCAEDRLQNI